jgi:hypothetical protein
MPAESHREPVSLADRLAAALIGALAMLLTLLGGYLVIFVVSAKAQWAGMGFVNALLPRVVVAVLLIAALGGFALGSRRLAEALAALWGTSQHGDSQSVTRVVRAIVIGLGALILGVVMLALGVELVHRLTSR